jgi:NADP-dependent 3-hydroxy acid dehydrogenase YdfG
MPRLQDRTVLVTGASAGIGRACARAFAAGGAGLVLLARRRDRLVSLASELEGTHGVPVRTFGLDVRDRDAVEAVRDELRDSDFVPDVVVNNAGKARGYEPLHEGDPDDWDEMVDTNVKGLLYVTRAFLPAMVEADRGHVVNIGSIAGRWTYPRGNVYCGTKFAVKGITEGMNMDLAGTAVRVSSVDPGLVETEFSEVRFHGDAERAETVYEGYRPLTAADIADVVTWVVGAPPHVDIFSVVVMPTAQRHSMVVHREDG